MPNQDDMKVGVLADLADIEQQGVRAGEAFKKGFGQGFGPGGIGGALLGNGMAPTQGPTAGPGADVASLLDKILQTLQTGFGRMLEASGGGLGGGAAPTGTFFKGQYDYEADKAQAQAKQQQQQGGGGGGGGGTSMGGVLGAANMFPQQAYANMYNSGFYSTNVAQFAASATSSVPILGQFMGVVANTMQQRDSALHDLIGVFRGGGVAAWKNFNNLMTGAGDADRQKQNLDFLKQYGVDRSEASQLALMGAQAGQSANPSTFYNLVQLQGLYGMGQQGAGLMGTLQRGGASGGDANLFANVLATAIGTNLDRGRWGEAFDSISKAASRIQTGDIDTQGVFGMMNLVGSMGARFRGDTAASQSAVGMLQGMQGGQGGAFGNIAALQAAGLGQPGVSFTEAWLKVQRGTAAGGVGLREVLKQYERLPAVSAYLSSADDDPKLEEKLSTAVFVLSRLLPSYKPTDIEALLRTMRREDYKNGDLFKGPRARDVTAMQTALDKGRLPQKEQDLMSSFIENNSSWSTNAIGTSADSFLSTMMPEKRDDSEAPMLTGSYTPTRLPVNSGGTKTSEDFMNQNVNPGRGFTGTTASGGHPGVDINVMPGQEVRSSVEGTITRVYRRSNGIEVGYNCFIREKGTNIEFRFFHMDPRKKPHSIIVGARVSHGTLLGYGAPQSMFKKGMQVHTHVGAFPDGGNTPVDPTNVTNLQEVISPSGDSAGTSGASTGGGVPSAMNNSSNSVDVNVYVYDGRVSVQKVASKGSRSGAPNRMYGKKG